MKKSPFYNFRNTVMTFEVEDKTSDTKDSAGNITPKTVRVTIEAFLKPVKRSNVLNYRDYVNLGVSEQFLEGYIVDPMDGYPDGINNLCKTVYAKYRDQLGEFTIMIGLQNSVGADKFTGHPVKGMFKIIGGQ